MTIKGTLLFVSSHGCPGAGIPVRMVDLKIKVNTVVFPKQSITPCIPSNSVFVFVFSYPLQGYLYFVLMLDVLLHEKKYYNLP